jgi:transposase
LSKEARMHVECHDTIEELRRAVRRERDGRVRDRIRAVVKARQGRTAKQVAADLGVSRRAVQKWVGRYNGGGLAYLPDAPRPGQPPRCPPEKLGALKRRITEGPRPEDGVCTLRGEDVKRILEKEFGVVQDLSTTYKLMHRLGLSPLRPRRRHVKNDPEAMAAWEAGAPLLCAKSRRPTPASGSRSGSRTRRGSASRGR